ncbi:hypothetical protein CC1G_15627 [Coprinopsis cinerea okayama7|uniref:Uncharacterized protein n=1 Tax=Coprinopsis cinerea (strain Okayama-7 / 130 / ATCC MYA-4618 / FGSC 9003) TaxID=240176 RepID=D6RNF7_COPC7|nr:hypothetical protein CC1G_15627 [Coprinopsis cinerea okayama7\|eukprot:XP_002911085.1 hypothetical protein CC1G_15627 [Coprinopsis cinerea okayama7\
MPSRAGSLPTIILSPLLAHYGADAIKHRIPIQSGGGRGGAPADAKIQRLGHAVIICTLVSEGFDSDSDENVLDSDEGDLEDDGSDNEQSTGDVAVAVQQSKADSDAEMSDGVSWSDDAFDDDSDFLESKDIGRARTLGRIQPPELSSREYSNSTWITFVPFTWTPWQGSTLWRKLA